MFSGLVYQPGCLAVFTEGKAWGAVCSQCGQVVSVARRAPKSKTSAPQHPHAATTEEYLEGIFRFRRSGAQPRPSPAEAMDARNGPRPPPTATPEDAGNGPPPPPTAAPEPPEQPEPQRPQVPKPSTDKEYLASLYGRATTTTRGSPFPGHSRAQPRCAAPPPPMLTSRGRS